MDKLRQLFCLGVLAAGLLATAGCAKLEARDQLNKGTIAFKNGQFNVAIEHFQNAIQLDPTLTNAKIYLATAYQSQFIPGAPSDDNLKLASQAVDVYQDILKTDPGNANATAGLASLYYNMGDFDNARIFYQKSLQITPNDPSAHYSLGAIDYQIVNRPLLAARASLGITDGLAPIVPAKGANAEVKKACLDLAKQYGPDLDDGISELGKALQLKPTYGDAMSYMNLLYRLKGDLTCGDDAARQADINIANDWVNKNLAERRAEIDNQNKQAQSGVVNDTTASPPPGTGH